MEIVSSAKPSFEDFLRDVRKATKGEGPIKVRIQPQTYHPGKGHHIAWPKTSYQINCETLDEVKMLKKGLDEFFAAVSRQGMAATIEALRPTKVEP